MCMYKERDIKGGIREEKTEYEKEREKKKVEKYVEIQTRSKIQRDTIFY